jgi:5'-phosphate synthase pdxT subunit
LTRSIGVLALQGDFREHTASLIALGADAREIRSPEQLRGLDGLIIPGGESTTIARLMLAYDLHEPLIRLGREGLPIWGTCAGAIMLADDVPGLDRPPLSLLPITIERNGFGRQIDSFEADLPAGALAPSGSGPGAPYHAVFIRAPRILRVGESVAVLMQLDEEPVAVRDGALLATTFHPELTADRRWHAYFLDSVVTAAAATKAAWQEVT